MRDYLSVNDLMSMLDLEQVSARLHLLMDRLQNAKGEDKTQLWVADRADIPFRTFQTWLGGKNEPTDRERLERLATFFRKQLKDATITRNWILYGQETPPDFELPSPGVVAALDGMPEKVPTQLEEIKKRLGSIDQRLGRVAKALEALVPEAVVQAAADAAQPTLESGPLPVPEPASNASGQAGGKRRAGRR